MSKLRNALEKFASAKIIIILLAVMIALNGSMILFTLPTIEANSGGIKAFDLNFFGYSYETAAAFLEMLSPESRGVYLYIQEPLDFLYPVATVLFFMLSIIFFRKKKDNLYLIALVPFILDLLENALVITMLIRQKTTVALTAAASAATVSKYISVAVVGCFVIILAVKYLVARRKARKI